MLSAVDNRLDYCAVIVCKSKIKKLDIGAILIMKIN